MDMYIRVKRIKTTYFIRCKPSDKILDIKQHLEELIDQPVNNQRLILPGTGEVLDDSKTLADQKIENDAVVALTLRKEPLNPREMADEIKDLRMSVAGLTKKVDELSGLSRHVAELTEGMNVMRELLLRMDQNSSKKSKSKRDTNEPQSDTETESNDDIEKGATKFRKLELPVFDGDDPIGWFCRVERYFHINHVPESEKLEAAVVCLENRALNWFQWKEARGAFHSWPEFKLKLLECFHTFQRGGEYKVLFSNKQEESVLEYVEAFERLSFPLKDATEDCLMGAFLYGLKTEIQAELEVAAETDLEGLIRMAIKVDGKNRLLELDKGSHTFKTPNNVGIKKYPTQAQHSYSRVTHFLEPARVAIVASQHSHATKPELKAHESTTGSSLTAILSAQGSGRSRRLPDAEMARRRELGLCYKCGEKYGPAHTCREKHLQVFLVDLEAENREQQAAETREGTNGLTEVEEDTVPKLSP